MKNSLYVIAGLLVIIWGIIYWGISPLASLHLILVAAGFIVLVRIMFSKQLSKK